mgnify:CR=1 FL=1
MNTKPFPVIDPIATGKNIIRLRIERGMRVRDLQAYFGFEEPQAIYKWQQGKSLPSVDNLYALGGVVLGAFVRCRERSGALLDLQQYFLLCEERLL